MVLKLLVHGDVFTEVYLFKLTIKVILQLLYVILECIPD